MNSCDNNRQWKNYVRKILVSEKELRDINFQRLKNTLVYIKNNLIDSDDNMYLTADSLTDLSNIISSSKNVSLRNVNVKPCRYDNMHIDKDKLYPL